MMNFMSVKKVHVIINEINNQTHKYSKFKWMPDFKSRKYLVVFQVYRLPLELIVGVQPNGEGGGGGGV